MDRIYDYEKAVNSIMGSTPDPEIYESIKTASLDARACMVCMTWLCMITVLKSFCYSACRAGQLIDLYAKPWAFRKCHDCSAWKLNIQAVIHADPKAVSNPREAEYQRDLEAAIYRSGLPLSYHDFLFRKKKEKSIFPLNWRWQATVNWMMGKFIMQYLMN